MPTSQDDLLELLDSMEIPLLFQPALEKLLKQPTLLEVKVDDKHLLSNVSDACPATCYSMPNTDKVVLTKLGVSAGDQFPMLCTILALGV